MSRHTISPEASVKGRASSARNRRTRTRERIEEFDFLTSQGIRTEVAALRAGWPSIEAAEIALRRAGRPCNELMAEVSRRRHSTEPVHVSEVMGGFLADLQKRAGGAR